MSSNAVVADGLWRCLCPSFGNLSTKYVRLLLRSHKRATDTGRSWTRNSSTSSSNDALSNGGRNAFNREDPSSKIISTARIFDQRVKPMAFKDYGGRETAKIAKSLNMRMLEHLKTRSTESLEIDLQNAGFPFPKYYFAMEVVKELIKNRGIKPRLQHYRAMIQANADGFLGSPTQVRKLLEEMEANGIPADSGTLHAALRVTC